MTCFFTQQPLMLLLGAVSLINAVTFSDQGTLWQPISVHVSTLKDPNHSVEAFTVGSKVMCAAITNQTFPDGLFCYDEGHCELHDLQIQASNDTCSDSGPATICYTQDPPVVRSRPFSIVSGLEVLGHLLEVTTPKTWADARAYCQCRGGDLLVVPTKVVFLNMAAKYVSISSEDNIWVGVVARKWLDGHAVDNQEWNPLEPNEDPNNCARMKSVFHKPYRLADKTCSNQYSFLCQK